MITEDYVSYEVAKLLKEKGFDELTKFVWYQHLPVSLDCTNLANKKARDYFYHDETTERNSSYKNSRHKPEYIHGDIFSCPTHQMAMKWLREEHNIIIAIRPPYNWNWKKPTNYLFDVWHYYDDNTDFNISVVSSTIYEEAVEAALKYCLTKLI